MRKPREKCKLSSINPRTLRDPLYSQNALLRSYVMLIYFAIKLVKVLRKEDKGKSLLTYIYQTTAG